jgi:hypothetical protein
MPRAGIVPKEVAKQCSVSTLQYVQYIVFFCLFFFCKNENLKNVPNKKQLKDPLSKKHSHTYLINTFVFKIIGFVKKI